MEEVLQEITEFVNQCLDFLGKQPELTEVSDTMSNIITIVMQLAATLILFLFVYFCVSSFITLLVEKI